MSIRELFTVRDFRLLLTGQALSWVGDAFHPAWAAAAVARRRGIPLIGFYHSNFPQLAGRRLGTAVQKLIEWYVKLTYEQCELVLAPSRCMCDYLRSIGVHNTA